MNENPVIRIRKERNLTRKDLALKTSIPYSTLCYVENGMNGELQPKTLNRIAKFAKLAPEQIAQEYDTWRQAQAATD